jgi:hypothetical protein
LPSSEVIYSYLYGLFCAEAYFRSMKLNHLFYLLFKRKPAFSGILIVLLIISSLTACKKNKTHTFVSGTVQNLHNGVAVAGARVYLAIQNPVLKAIDSTTTNQKGFFGFDFTAADGSSYAVFARASSYFSSPAANGITLSAGKISNMVVPLIPFSFLRIRAIDSNPFDWNDRIIIQGISIGSITLHGPAIDTSFSQVVTGATINTIHYTVIKRNRPSSFAMGIYCTDFDTAHVQINY